MLSMQHTCSFHLSCLHAWCDVGVQLTVCPNSDHAGMQCSGGLGIRHAQQQSAAVDVRSSSQLREFPMAATSGSGVVRDC